MGEREIWNISCNSLKNNGQSEAKKHQYLDPCFLATSGPKWAILASLERELATDSKYIIVFHTEMF